MAKTLSFKYKGSDRQLFKMTSVHKDESPVTAVAGIDLSHLTEAERTELKQELDRHDAAMSKFMKAAYRKFTVSEMETDMVEGELTV